MNFEIAPKEYEIRGNWDDSRFYCFALNIDGKSDWRLPTKEELNEIFQSAHDFEDGSYWSSTPSDVDEVGVRVQIFDTSGFEYSAIKSSPYGYTRAVRTI
jgi:hypothetical protein